MHYVTRKYDFTSNLSVAAVVGYSDRSDEVADWPKKNSAV